MPPAGDQPKNPIEDLRLCGNVVLIALAVLAGAYRVPMTRPGSFGRRAIGLVEALGVCLGFPAFLAWGPPGDAIQAENALLVWHGLWILLMFQWVCAKLARAPRHSHDVGAPWSGRCEPLVFLLAGGALFAFCGPGAALFFGLGGVCHYLQLRLIRARFRRMGQIVLDQRLEAGVFRRSLNEFE